MSKTTETFWAIWNESVGLYSGTWFTRREAIRRHCFRRLPYNHPDAEWFGRELAAPQDAVDRAWSRCRRHGDHVVKVAVSVRPEYL